MLSNNVLAQNLLTLSELYNLQSVLQNLNSNLILISEGSTGKIISGSNISLFALAAQYYGDATQWKTIADANNLVDPYMTGGTLLQIKVVDGGSNYVAPFAVIRGGEIINATTITNVVDGVIVSVDILSGGLYKTLPTIFFQDNTIGGGNGAVAVGVCVASIIVPQTSNPLSAQTQLI